MQSLKTPNKTTRYLPLLTFTLLTTALGCGGNGGSDGGKGGSSAGEGSGADGGADTGGGGGTANGGTTGGGGTTGDGGATGDGGTTATGGSADGGADTGGGGSTANGGSGARAGSTGTGGSGGTGGTSTGGTGGSGGVTNPRSCEQDCIALASTLCAEDDFTQEKCVMDCEQAFQDAAAGAESTGCLDEFLVVEMCRADDPVCTHPNPAECVPENDAYIQCLEDNI